MAVKLVLPAYYNISDSTNWEKAVSGVPAGGLVHGIGGTGYASGMFNATRDAYSVTVIQRLQAKGVICLVYIPTNYGNMNTTRQWLSTVYMTLSDRNATPPGGTVLLCIQQHIDNAFAAYPELLGPLGGIFFDEGQNNPGSQANYDYANTFNTGLRNYVKAKHAQAWAVGNVAGYHHYSGTIDWYDKLVDQECTQSVLLAGGFDDQAVVGAWPADKRIFQIHTATNTSGQTTTNIAAIIAAGGGWAYITNGAGDPNRYGTYPSTTIWDTLVAQAPGAAPTFTVTPSTASVIVSGTVSLAPSAPASWAVTEAAGGSVTAGGVYTAPATVGTYHVVATATTGGATATAIITVTAANPWDAAVALPGTIQAENYRAGGEGVGYHKTTTGANPAGGAGAIYRNDPVGVEVCSDTGGGYDVGYTDAGDWLSYAVTVASAVTLSFTLRLGTALDGRAVHLTWDGVALAAVAVPNTGSYQTYTDVAAGGVVATTGAHVLRLSFDTAGVTANSLTAATVAAAVPTITVVSPTSGTTLGGTVVTLTGTGFTGTTGVTFDGVAGTSLTVNSNTSLTITTPAHAARGLVNVVVTNATGASLPFVGGYRYVVLFTRRADHTPHAAAHVNELQQWLEALLNGTG